MLSVTSGLDWKGNSVSLPRLEDIPGDEPSSPLSDFPLLFLPHSSVYGLFSAGLVTETALDASLF